MSIRLKVITPKEIVFSGAIYSIAGRSIEGNFCVYTNHSPYFALLRAGAVFINSTLNSFQILLKYDGVLKISENICTILTEEAELKQV